MSRTFSFRKAAIQTVTAITGPTHLMVQTTADLIAHSEGYLVHKINPKISKQQAVAFRRTATKSTQADYKVAAKDISKALKGTFKVPTAMDSL